MGEAFDALVFLYLSAEPQASSLLSFLMLPGLWSCPSGILSCHAESLQSRGERVSEGALHPGVVKGAQVLGKLLDVLPI